MAKMLHEAAWMRCLEREWMRRAGRNTASMHTLEVVEFASRGRAANLR